MTTASESDFIKITNELGPDELQHLFHNLGIPQRDIEHAERSADTTDTRLRARAVLGWWKKKEGRSATIDRLIHAKMMLKTGNYLPKELMLCVCHKKVTDCHLVGHFLQQCLGSMLFAQIILASAPLT